VEPALDSIAELWARFSPETVVVLYGWACNLDVPDLWQEMPTPTPALRAFIRASMERGVYDLGESDLYNQDPHESFRSLLCHESDIHFRSTDESLVNIVEAAWQDVYLDPRDTEPYIAVRLSLSAGKFLGTPKSGRQREVQLSARLKAVLIEWRSMCGTLGDGTILSIDDANYRNRAFAWMVKKAKLPTVEGRTPKPKELRDSYASYLLSAGIPLPYVSEQLGHSDVGTTARHYTRWIGRGRYVPPPLLEEGEVPSDLISRCDFGESSGKSHNTSHKSPQNSGNQSGTDV